MIEDLPLFYAIIMSHDVQETKKKTFQELSIPKDANQHINVKHLVKGENVTLWSDTCVSCAAMHNDPSREGDFYLYRSRTQFIATGTDITPGVVAELALMHLGIVGSRVIYEALSRGLTYRPGFHSLSKIILAIESQWKG